ncbi:MAG: putative cyclase [Frankiales bacterium]|nr:putative cyclase [Frankiales bacterium]
MLTQTTEELNKERYRAFVAELNKGNIDGVDEFFAPDYTEHSAPPGAPPGVETIKMVFHMFRTAFPDVVFTVTDLVAEGDKLCTYVIGEGTNEGPFMGAPASGRHATWAAFGINRYENGRIKEHWGLPDLMGLLTQIGALPAPAHP